MVLNRSTGSPIPYTRIVVNNGSRFGLTNEEGFYSVPVVDTDVIEYKCIGYKTSKLAIGEYLRNYSGDTNTSYIYEIHYLIEDTLTLPTIIIYPYKNATDIKMAIRNIDSPYEMELSAIASNVNPELISYLMSNLPQDEAERIQMVRLRYETMVASKGYRPTYANVDPIAVFNLINYMHKQKKAKKEEILKSFED